MAPWHIEEDHPDCPASRPYGVVKDDDGDLEGCHASRDAAQDQMAALYSSGKGMTVSKHVALFEVKAVTKDGSDPNGEFEAILSVPTLDRDGEVIDARAFEPLPAELPIHKYHDFSAPVATAVPYYDGDVLKARGVFDPDPESQAIRHKVGRSIRYMSVGFMAATRADVDGVPHITKGELLEASFVSVPSNREAAILAVKQAGYVTADEARLLNLRQELADIKQLLERLAAPGGAADRTAATDPEEKAAGSAAAEAPAGSAAEPPAEATAGHQLRVALLRLEADLAAMNAAH